MTQRDLDEAVARLRAASLRNDPAAGDLAPDLGPPRGRPESAGQGPLDPDIVDAHAHVVDGHEAPTAGGTVLPRSDFVQPLPRQGQAQGQWHGDAPLQAASPEAVRARAVPRENVAPAPVLEPDDRRAYRQAGEDDDYERFAADGESEGGLRARLPAFLRRGGRSGVGGGRPAPEAHPSEPPPAYEEPPAPADAADERAPRSLLRRGRSREAVREKPVRGRAALRHQGPLSEREKRWERRRKRHVLEEILGWVLVPVILVGLYWAVIFGLSLLGLTLDDVVAGAQQAWDALQ
ncbi:hypothetical protein [Salinarimonas ramus]|uniref:Uncharacterized protein n=1 Tax=Salinarimonas ramus TaxID=690164 RepID=A0A917Q6Z8_9HYPH|nr:hypothetical protein [Salinarimonas ramus]GGK29940.1 hypothetical protein GCM10011322_15570 [Salinarimonas ramus]